jgi:DnaK suppressor protein
MKNTEMDMNANELNEFRITLSEMKSRIETNIARLREELEGVATDEGINDMEDLASLESESMHHNALLAQQQRELAEVLHALSKIEEGRYGICEESGDAIPLERLRAEPHARYCIRDAAKHEL